jgi:hypothetical protein
VGFFQSADPDVDAGKSAAPELDVPAQVYCLAQVSPARLKMPRVAADAAALYTPGAVQFAARSFADVAPGVAAEPLVSRPQAAVVVERAAEAEPTLQALHSQQEVPVEAQHVAVLESQAARLPPAVAAEPVVAEVGEP